MQEVMQPVQEATLTTGGWVTMILSLGIVWVGTFWCFRKVLSSPSEEHIPPGYGP